MVLHKNFILICKYLICNQCLRNNTIDKITKDTTLNVSVIYQNEIVNYTSILSQGFLAEHGLLIQNL